MYFCMSLMLIVLIFSSYVLDCVRSKMFCFHLIIYISPFFGLYYVNVAFPRYHLGNNCTEKYHLGR